MRRLQASRKNSMFAHRRVSDWNTTRRESNESTRRTTRSGFTLLEVMIATAVTLLMMISLAQIFKTIGDSMKQGRSVLELNNRLRTVAYRIRSDLENLTAIPNPPADATAANGYLKIFDGSLTDSTAAMVSLAHSRFGDVDDIFMGTVRAGDVWFTGKVPAYILERREPVSAADFNLVTIAAQHAEVIAFVQPLVTSEGNPRRDPEFYLTSNPAGALAFQDADAFPGFPDAFRLHYRTLLIRPDLNLTSPRPINGLNAVAPAGALPGGVHPTSRNDWTIARQQQGLPSPLCDMASAHVQCDLSLRRVFRSGDVDFDFVAANSLEDLVDPANRFAHVQVPIPGTASTTLPLLALGQRLAINAADPNGNLGTNSFQVGSGFLHPAFTLRGVRAGEDILASDILAFDFRLYDPGVPLLRAADNTVLSPKDPGYGAILGNPVDSFGDYVDVGWARKLVAHGASIPAGSNVWSPLSGFSLANFTANGVGRAFSDELYHSGLVMTSGANVQILQPAYDTWTTRYEGDGILQASLPGREGIVRINGARDLYGAGGNDIDTALPSWRRTSIDAGTDGIDNRGTGRVDDISELETSAPFPVRLRGLKVTIRMEDPLTRQVKQMSVGKEFVTQ